MREFYRAFEWVIRPMYEINLLIHKKESSDLDYDLALMNHSIVDNDYIASLCFIMGADSEQTFADFHEKIGTKLDIGNWRPSFKEEFDRGLRFPELFEGMGYGSWLDGVTSVGWENLKRLDQVDEGYQYYFVCDWLITEDGLKDFAHVYDDAKRLGLLMYNFYHTVKNDCHYYRLAIRVPSEDYLKQFIEGSGKKIGLTDWQPITQTGFYFYGLRFYYGNHSITHFIEMLGQYAAENTRICTKHFLESI